MNECIQNLKISYRRVFWWTIYEYGHIFLNNAKHRETWKWVIVAIVYDVADFICFKWGLGFPQCFCTSTQVF